MEIQQENLPVIQEDEAAAEKLKKEPKEVNTIAGAIVFAGLLIAGSILYTGSGERAPTTNVKTPEAVADTKIDFEPVTEKDHILGSANAPVMIIEYSDLECPFCKQFHGVLKQAIDKYGPSGKVAWVYRHFPLNIHPKAIKEAEATECAAEQGGNLMFWKYTDRIFEITPSNNGLDLAELEKTARYLNLDVNKFKTCLDGGKYTNKIEQDIDKAIAAGATGTPYSVIVVDGKAEALKGSVTYERLESIIEEALGN